MENTTAQIEPNQNLRKDVAYGALAGFLIGLLILPIINAGKKELYEQVKLVIIPFFLIAVPLGLCVAYFISKKIAVVWQLAKFVVTGGLNTVIDIGVFAFLIAIFKNTWNIDSKDVLFMSVTFYSLYKALSFIIANTNSYFWNKFWTFKKEQTEKSTQEFIQFFAVSLVGLIINTIAASYVFKSIPPLAGLQQPQWELIGAAAGSIAGLAWNFIGYKLWVFKK